MVRQPDTHYAKGPEGNIAYQVVGEGPMDLVVVPGWLSHVDLQWGDPGWASFVGQLASFARVILYDKRGTGLSDPVDGIPTLESHADDLRAVFDAADCDRAALFGFSEGGPISVLFAASFPERVSSLILYGTYAYGSLEPDGSPGRAKWIAGMAQVRSTLDHWGEGQTVEWAAPSLSNTLVYRRATGALERAGMTQKMARLTFESVLTQIDVRDILGSVRVPTLVLHRKDEAMPVEFGRELAAKIPSARLIELDGVDHWPGVGDIDSITDEIEEFLTGHRHEHVPDRALATVLFTDIVDSTRRAVELGDRRWRELLERHDEITRDEIARFQGRVVKHTGDGFLATFDGPTRAVHCATALAERIQELGIDVRSGLHTGECELRGDDIGGIAVHIGARIAAKAQAAEVLVSSTVKDLVNGSGIIFRDRGIHTLKGVPGEWRLFAPVDRRRVGSESPARLEVRLLGAVEVILDGRRLGAFNSLRLQRFLALLALRRDAQHRSRLAFELWPDSDERQARTNLRKLLHDFRHSLPDIGEFVHIDNEIVRWIPTGPSEVDALKFRDAIAAGDLELAARLYSGDLLPACYDDWVLDERANLRTEAYGVLVRLRDEAAGRDDHEATIRHAQAVIDLEPTDEVAVRIQMAAHLALGDRGAALRSYHRYAEVLQRELAVEPGEAIRAMYRQLRADTRTRRAPHGEDAAPVADLPFVGRDLDLDRLNQAWNTARDGRAHLVLVSGEAGIGKSRLALELGRRVRAEGHVVVSARAYEAAGRLPWGPVVDLLRSDALRSHIDTLGTVWRAELARLLPEFVDASRPPAPSRSGDLAARHRLFDAVGRAIVGDRPRLLIIDDLQWCDAETIELIGFVINSGQTAPVLIVGTVRSEEIPEHHPLVGLVNALGRDKAVTTVPLARLDKATTATLAARLRNADTIDSELAARLWAETEGNPLFVIEVLRAGISLKGSQTALTPTMRAVLGARLDQLSDGARRLAEVAAVIGRPFSVGLLGSATGIGEPALVDGLDELWRRRIIRDQGLTYDFSHDKLRAVALEMLSPARRRQLHRAVAEAIAVEFHHDLDAASAALAAHYDQAGMVEPAIDAYRVAGARAVAVSALDEAVTMFRRALSLLAELPPSPARDALELDIRIALGSPLVALEGYGSQGAHQLYERALSLCRKLHRAVDPPILRGLGLARVQGCRFDECSELGQALVDHESHDPVARTEGRYLLGVSAFWRGDLARARQYLEGAIDAYDVSHRDEHLALYAQDPKAVCLVRLAWVDLWAGDAGRADERARSALQLAVDLDHFLTRWYVLTYAAIIAAESEDLVRLAELLGDAEFLGKRLPTPYFVIAGEALRGWLDVCEGSPGGIERIVRSVERSRTEGESLHLTYTLLLLARARGLAGELHEGRAATREALSLSHRRNQRYLEAELWRVDGELAYRSGAPEAAASLRRAVEVADAQGSSWLELRALHSLASRYPDDRALREQLGDLVETIPSGHGLPAFRAATGLLNESG